jgi:hypothetical protein
MKHLVRTDRVCRHRDRKRAVGQVLADTTPSAEQPYPLECALIPSGGADHTYDPTDYEISAVLDDGSGSVFGNTYSPAYQGTYVPIVCREKQP